MKYLQLIAFGFLATTALATHSREVNSEVNAESGDAIGSTQQRVQNPFSDIQGMVVEHLHIQNQEGFGDQKSDVSALRLFNSFKIDEGDYIVRVITPYAHDLAFGGDGLGDTTIALGRTFGHDWGVLGYGLQAVVPTGTDDFSDEGYRLGPLFGVVRIEGPLQYGAINFNEFTVAKDSDAEHVNLSKLQLLGAYHLGKGFTVGLSEMMIEYDWEASKFTRLPLGISVSQIMLFKNMIARAQLAFEHDFADGIGGDGDTIRLRFTFLRR